MLVSGLEYGAVTCFHMPYLLLALMKSLNVYFCREPSTSRGHIGNVRLLDEGEAVIQPTPREETALFSLSPRFQTDERHHPQSSHGHSSAGNICSTLEVRSSQACIVGSPTGPVGMPATTSASTQEAAIPGTRAIQGTGRTLCFAQHPDGKRKPTAPKQAGAFPDLANVR